MNPSALPVSAAVLMAYVAVLLGYLLSGGLALRAVSLPRAPVGGATGRSFSVEALLRASWLPLALLLHGWLLHRQIFEPGGVHFGFAHALSATCWLAALLTWTESLRHRAPVMEALAYPAAALFLALPDWFPGVLNNAVPNTDWFKWHMVISIGAYCLFTLAAAHAIVMSAQEKQLHRPMGNASGQSPATLRWLEQLPPLLTMERLLFRMIGAGFVLLTLTVVSGIGFSEDLYGRPFKADHKTLFAIVSWLIFGVLLAGRWLAGWRGKRALRFTLAGFATLFLAYVGTRFVLEVILQRAA